MSASPIRRDDPSMALPRVSAMFSALVVDGNLHGKLVLNLGDSVSADTIAQVMMAMDDGPQTVVFVSQSKVQYLPGTEPEEFREPAARVAVGLELRRELSRALLEQRDPQTGRIESTGPRTDIPPLLAVGTTVGDTEHSAGAAVDAAAEVDPASTARAAGRALASRRRKQ